MEQHPILIWTEMGFIYGYMLNKSTLTLLKNVLPSAAVDIMRGSDVYMHRAAEFRGILQH